MTITRSTEFNVVLEDGAKLVVKLEVSGSEYWDWYPWYNAQERALLMHLKKLGYTKLPKSADWSVGC